MQIQYTGALAGKVTRISAGKRPLAFSEQAQPGGAKEPVKTAKKEAAAQPAPGTEHRAKMAEPMQEETQYQTTYPVSEEGSPRSSTEEGERFKGPSPAIGIDLGTSFSRVAVWHEGEIKLIPLDEKGNKEIPSCVAVGGSPDDSPGDRVLIGWPAFERVSEGGATHRARRIVGRVDTDESLQSGSRFWPFLVQLPGIGIRPVIALKKGDRWESVTPEEVLTLQLHYLKRAAERFLGRDVSDAVLTSPAAFTRFQCSRLAAAAAAAGLRVQRIVAEPNAVGLLHAAENKQRQSARGKATGEREAQGEQEESGTEGERKESGMSAEGERKESGPGEETGGGKGKQKEPEDEELNVLVFHLGSGYCSVGIVSIDEGVSESRAIAGAPFGTDDFVNNLVARALADHRARDPAAAPPSDRKILFQIWQTYREAMQALSEQETVNLPQGFAVGTTLNRAYFEDANASLFRACVEMVARCLADARLKPSGVAEVLLLGGGTKIAKMDALLREMFSGEGGGERRVKKGEEVDDRLVKGAALEAAIAGGMEGVDKDLLLLQISFLLVIVCGRIRFAHLMQRKKSVDWLLMAYLSESHNKTSSKLQSLSGINHPLGIKVQGDIFMPILHRNSLIPTSRELIFTTVNDNQESAIIQIYEGDQPAAEQDVFLGCFQVGPLPPARAGHPMITVCLDVDAGDSLRACARVNIPEKGSPGSAPAPLVVKMPSVDVGHGWCTEALRIKYGTSADVRLYETVPAGGV
ncbi:heat-shock protein 70T-2 [Klebsormidium nitens]|uniref:Heat-shock protein 70T-2 n=1 Tax=Klebsormidium nitens TaxID=105231 RepID=A0A1Y1IPB3_KLENI|nr:heat-shock protein 70T-2 [Klebsormidium nitens]|eukprot:GAQ89958.1 heat-shock protein 70T-2 [Klebsormidium nitens]